jgi:hypothetical protein
MDVVVRSTLAPATDKTDKKVEAPASRELVIVGGGGRGKEERMKLRLGGERDNEGNEESQ